MSAARVGARERPHASPTPCRDDGSSWHLRAAALAGERDESTEIVVEDAAGRPVGRAAYRRVYGPRAVLSLDAGAAVWESGLAAKLLAAIRRNAADAGIATLLIRVPAEDARLLALLDGEGAVRSPREDGDVDVDLPVG